MLDTPNRPRSDLEPFFTDRPAAHLADAVAAVGNMTPSAAYVVQHREQMLLCRYCGQTVDSERGPLADTLAEGDRAELVARLGQLTQLNSKLLLPIGQQAFDVRIHLARLGRR